MNLLMKVLEDILINSYLANIANSLLWHWTDRVRCVVGVRHQAVIQVKQFGPGSVLA